MKIIILKVEKRVIVNKKHIKSLREYGYTPCIVYGKNKNIKFVLDSYLVEKIIKNNTLSKFIVSINHEINLTTILKEIQYNPMTDQIMHLDFLELNPRKYITYEVPIKSIGKAKGVYKGGEYISKIRNLKIKALPKNMVDHIEINLENLDIGENYYVKNIPQKKLVILHDSKTVISAVKQMKKETATVTATMEKPKPSQATPTPTQEQEQEQEQSISRQNQIK
ncbi:50S ribosomal protein L25 [Candidatus Karelsulcia muelleri]